MNTINSILILLSLLSLAASMALTYAIIIHHEKHVSERFAPALISMISLCVISLYLHVAGFQEFNYNDPTVSMMVWTYVILFAFSVLNLVRYRNTEG